VTGPIVHLAGVSKRYGDVFALRAAAARFRPADSRAPREWAAVRGTPRDAGTGACASYTMMAEKCVMHLVAAIPDCFFALRLLF